MPRTVATYLRLLNLCALHKADLHTVAGLLAVNALADMDFEMLSYLSKVSSVEMQRQAS